MKLIKCDRHKNTFLASNETLLDVLRALFTDPNIEIYKIQRCECMGWHIFVEHPNKKRQKPKNNPIKRV